MPADETIGLEDGTRVNTPVRDITRSYANVTALC